MIKKIFPTLLIAAAVSLLTPSPAHASVNYFTDFNSQQPDLFYEIFEGGIHYPGQACRTDACLSFETQGQRTFGKFTVNQSATPGFYQNAATSQVQEPGPADQGPYNVSYGHPITMEAKIKWSDNYDLYGQSDAQGTSGIAFWNGALDENGQTPDYDQIGFGWNSVDVIGGYIAGFNAASFVDLNPVGVSYPAQPFNLHEWTKVKMVWSQDANGVQHVAYYAADQYLGTHDLPSQLHGLSLEIWNDNQEPNFCDQGICNNFPNPDQSQSFYVDYVKITQP